MALISSGDSGGRVAFLPDGIADHAGEIADQENDVMTELLKLAHLVDQDRVTDMQIRRRRVEAGFDDQRPAQLQLRLESVFGQDLVGAPASALRFVP